MRPSDEGACHEDPMLRTAAIVLTSLVILSGCKKKDEAAQEGAAGRGGEPAPTATANAPSPAATAAPSVDWAKIERVPFATLQTLLPETLPTNLKRTDLAGSTNPDGENTNTEAGATYEGPNDAYLRITVTDHPVHARELMPSKTTSFKGYPVVSESEGGGVADVQLVVGDRFVVTAHANELKVAQVKSALEPIDLAKLASWKDQGVKK